MVMGDLVREVDVAIVGGGPGGYSAAFRCAELGLEAVVVDASAKLGGACLFEGCIPSKALLHVAAVMHDVESARVVGRLARGLASVAKSKGVEVIGGRAVFEDSRGLRVEGDAPQKIRFKHAIVATGSVPAALPGIAGSDRVMDSTAALDLVDVPERLLVVGGGYIGLELGTVYATLGSQVTLVELMDGLLPGVDRDLVQPLARRVDKLFAAIHLKSRVVTLEETSSAIEAAIDTRGVERFDRALIAVGRRATSGGIGLEATRARADERGFIRIDDRCRTEDPHIYAVGDVTGEPMLAHRAMRQGKVAAEVIAGRPAAFDNVAVPALVFTDPEVAWCGLTEREAKQAGTKVRNAKFQWAASGRAATLGRSDGLTNLLIDPESGRVLGAGAVGP